MKNLHMAYSVKKKKMAKGGPVSAKTEKRPMPSEEDNDKKNIEQNSSRKDNKESGWTDRPDIAQSQNKPKSAPIKHPRMVPTDAFSTKMYDKEGNLQESAHPESPDDDKAMYAEGGDVEPKPQPSPSPSKILDSVRKYVNTHTDGGPKEYARGGEVSPEAEESEEHRASIASAIMAKKARERGHPHGMSDSDIDEMVMLYDGGEVDMASNHEEEPNNEDQMSFQALNKENYNDSDLDANDPSDSDEQGDKHESSMENVHDDDMISEIRRRMKSKQSK